MEPKFCRGFVNKIDILHEGIMLPSNWENLSLYSTKLIHVCKKLQLTLDCT